MTSTNEDRSGHADSLAVARARQSERLKTRADRWARLCGELSAHAVELKELHNTLMPDESKAQRREPRLDAQRRELEQRESEVEQRQQALKRRVSEFARRRKQLITWQTEFEAVRRQECDQHLQKAAQIEQHAEGRLAEAVLWTEELDAYDAELCDLLRQFDIECEQIEADLGEPPEADSPS